MSLPASPERSPGIEPLPPEPVWRRRAVAVASGLVCHGTFLVAITAMFLALGNGLTSARGPLSGTAGWLVNGALALQFPLLHSTLLTRRGRGVLARCLGARHGRALAPTTYAWTAALQILATFTLWSPSGIVWWRPEGRAALAMGALYGGAWLFLGKALYDSGLGLQTGWIGWTAVWRGRRVAFPDLPRHGCFALCRQPIYLGFALTLWTGPVWTPDRLLLALVWSAYCVLGPLLKERRYGFQYGDAFAEYRRRVPYMLPIPRRSA